MNQKEVAAAELLAIRGCDEQEIATVLKSTPSAVQRALAHPAVQSSLQKKRAYLVDRGIVQLLRATRYTVKELLSAIRATDDSATKLAIAEFLFEHLYKFGELAKQAPAAESKPGEPAEMSALPAHVRELIIRQTAYPNAAKSSANGADGLRVGTGKPEVVPTPARADAGV